MAPLPTATMLLSGSSDQISPVLGRGRVMAALAGIAFLNGIVTSVFGAVAENGVPRALVDTFGISVIVWGSVAFGLHAVFRSQHEPLSRWDLVVLLVAGAL